jgi:lipid II:glycine glycyltransferase (peptidoglycan interpeptide bridge formation enzyme)
VDELLRRHGYLPAPSTNQPRATIVVDMADGSDAALARMHQKARYNIRRAERVGVEIRTGTEDDLPALHAMLRSTAERAGFQARDLDYYRAEWETFAADDRLRLFVASYEGEALAMNVSAVCGSIGAYLHGASTDRRRDLNPNEFLMWHAMRWAEDHGCTSFDLWGIPDEAGEADARGEEITPPERPTGLWGVYGFKRRMGSRIELSTRAHDLIRPRAARPLVRRLAKT